MYSDVQLARHPLSDITPSKLGSSNQQQHPVLMSVQKQTVVRKRLRSQVSLQNIHNALGYHARNVSTDLRPQRDVNTKKTKTRIL